MVIIENGHRRDARDDEHNEVKAWKLRTIDMLHISTNHHYMPDLRLPISFAAFDSNKTLGFIRLIGRKFKFLNDAIFH